MSFEKTGEKQGDRESVFSPCFPNISLQYQSGLKTVTIEGQSWTHLLDITKKSRSYQKLGISYQEFVGDVLKDYVSKGYIIALPDSAKYNTFAVQYWETDWQLLRRK